MKTVFAATIALAFVLATELRADDAADCREHWQAENYYSAYAACTAAAEQGLADAQYSLGWMYRLGLGVAQDYAEAVRWYRAAAEQAGGDRAKYYLGLMYEQGLGVAQDYAEAVRWYRAAAEQGYVVAQYYLGVMYESGRGVAQDYIYAHMWFNIAAANGLERAIAERDRVAGMLTREQVVEAQQRAQQCMSSNYTNC